MSNLQPTSSAAPVATGPRAKAVPLLPTPEEWAQLKELADVAVKSGCLPSSIKTREAALIIALKGWELKLPPMLAWSYIAVVNGRPTIAAELMLAYIKADFPGAEMIWDASETHCILKAKRPSDKDYTTFKWDMDRAKKMGLAGKDNWIKQPGTMMRWRCVSEMKRFLFPEVLMGIDYTVEELEDMKDVTNSTSANTTAPTTQGASQIEAKSLKPVSIVPPPTPEPKAAEPSEIVVEEESSSEPTAPTEEPKQGELNFEAPKLPTREELIREVNLEFKRLNWKAERVQKMIKDTFQKAPQQLSDNEMSAFIGLLRGYKAEDPA